ncbi:MAG: pesticidal protein Cry7Aa [Bacteroidetes bacterium]|nr:pesticidal protein Cry7Aa [Bacteroidota bacterium]
MLNINKLGILLQKTTNSFECEGVLNPGVIKVGEVIHVFYRAVTKDNYSTIGYCKLSAPMVVESRNNAPILVPQSEYEFQGLEDPRIVAIEGTYYLTYTAFDGVNALGALATSTDLVHWQKNGILVPQITYEEFKHFAEGEGNIHEKYIRFNEYNKSHEKQDRKVFLWDKNLVFFPRKINNQFCFLHRIKPDIQIIVAIEKIEDLTIDFWQKYFSDFDKHIVLAPKYHHEVSYIGGGCPPIETAAGWLIIYHGVHDTIKGYVYSACAALLDLENPQKEIARLPYPLFFPEKQWELKGEVNNVCFPTGAIVENDTLYIYYGAADERIAVASVSMKELLAELALNKTEETPSL